MLLQPTLLAERAFGSAALGDPRRVRRAVQLGTALFTHPAASLPQQNGPLKHLRAAYRLLDRPEVTHAVVQQPHWLQTRQDTTDYPVVLLLQDTTELDYTGHPTTTGLGPIGNGGGRGFLLQTILAVVPRPRQVLGVAYQEPFLRRPAPRQTSARRKHRDRESQVWPRAATACGAPPPGTRWVHVGDAYSDLFDFLHACRARGADFLVRACQDRCIERPDGQPDHLMRWARALPAQGEGLLDLPARSARPGQPARAARAARLRLAFGAATVRPPAHGGRGQAALPVWVVRVWEVDAPAGVEPLEWVLVTSVPVTTPAEAWERVAWYRCRWLCEDYHQCLKTGCAMERRQLQTGAGLQRLLGFLGVVAVWLLQLREWSREAPERRAEAVVPADVVRVVAVLAGQPGGRWTVAQFWKALAGLGGYLGRKGDGPPGWKTLWRGWLHVQTVLIGVQIAHELGP
jgi:hypothetical protein